VLWLVGIIALVAWAMGAWAVPEAGVWRHIPLVLGLISIGYALARRRGTA
jgi:hypothetical protein